MYSAAARPSSTRAAPAKNRSWSTIGGISSDAVRLSGFPVWLASRATMSSALASIASASFSSAACRSPGVVRPQLVRKAASAAAYAASTSEAADTGARAITAAVAGSITSVKESVAAST